MEENILYDSEGNSVAYIVPDDENTIYLWTGEPIAYLDDEHIYGFNGKHLGWLEDGVIWDHKGERVGFDNGSLPVFAKFEPFKSFKQFKPFRAFKVFAPFKPIKSTHIAAIPLRSYLLSGKV